MTNVWNDPEYRRNYHRKYYLKHREKLKSNSSNRYSKLRNDPKFRKEQKHIRELKHFGVLRSVIFNRSNGKCVKCNRKAEVVHHMDHDGRNHEARGVKPGHNPNRLQAMCRSCHMKHHWQQLKQARIDSGCGVGVPLPDGRWSRNYKCCVSCGRTDKRHNGKGKCVNCAARHRKRQAPGV